MNDLKSAIEASLTKFWEERALDVDDESESLADFVDELDSLTAVDALIEIEKIVDIEIDEGAVIRKGGYDSKQQFVEHLTAKVLKYVQEHKK
jgi:acyl carrier protein